jgi:hypothetical protein
LIPEGSKGAGTTLDPIRREELEEDNVCWPFEQES